MRTVKYLLVLAMACVTCVSCLMDVPEVEFSERKLEVAAEGGDYIIKVVSTGVDDVYINYDNLEYGEDGNLYPSEEWITLNKVIYDYIEDDTRALAMYTSGVDITVAPNTTGKTRKARIYARSFTKNDYIDIVQAAE